MPEIVTITLNPAVDVATAIERVVDTRKLRCSAARRDPGGGGINVARVIQRLGGDCTGFYVAGGATGVMLGQLLDAEAFVGVGIAITGETRENFSVLEQCSGLEYRFVLPGPTLATTEWQRCIDEFDALQVAPRYLVMSGSLPPGAPVDIYARLARLAAARGTRAVLDTSGPALGAALDAGVWLVKPSLGELRELTGQPLIDESEWIGAAQHIVRAGQARMVAVTLGERGALLVTEDRCLRAAALPTKVCSSIGAGDSFVGALIWALNRNAGIDEAFRYGMAAAAATLLGAGTALCERGEIERLYREISIG
ncbi:Putative ATP-dependent 6-phosphofructokinase isozyme 2 [Paraburkholderia phenoliruptrix]|uniref:Phosphofructokinase n=1 Tax=Paraburkholderia phenoliruptrix TaxID=252970 RepID=A0A6J4ZR42_9BURK|nr:1-phosphofructokinase family hexose kinase [Paraburkholderia phenoliruptrix]CAB3638552.1 Putative ATP-dependent 6-phosphofructokinase isozyme 2 [Paraburkholderia phenoliruptrix]